MNDETVSPDQLSVRELRQWLANLGEKHQDHFNKGQLPKGRTQDKQEARQSTSTQELESINVAEASRNNSTRQEGLVAHRNEKASKELNKSAYSNEDPNWFFRTVDQERRISTISKTVPCHDTSVSSGSHSSDGSTHEQTRHRVVAFPPDDFRWTSSACRERKAVSKSTNSDLEGSKGLAMLDRLSIHETSTSMKNRRESAFAQTTRVFPTAESTLPNVAFTEQIDVEDRGASKRVERAGGKSMVQERQRALLEKWAQDRQLVHKKKVQWRALKGTYKKKVVLSVEEEI